MHCWKRLWTELLPLFVIALLWMGLAPTAHAQSTPQSTVVLKVERTDNILYLSSQLDFELPQAVEDALIKGVAIYFVAEVEVFRDRWYWSNLKINHLQRHMRLAYHPLTRRWRLNVAAGEFDASAQGMALNQNFDNLHDALEGIKRLTPWRLLDLADIDLEQKHYLNFRFRLDLAQLPRPLQIGTLGQSDWQILISARQELRTDTSQ